MRGEEGGGRGPVAPAADADGGGGGGGGRRRSSTFVEAAAEADDDERSLTASVGLPTRPTPHADGNAPLGGNATDPTYPTIG